MTGVSSVIKGGTRRWIFAFPGQGTQYIGMGKGAYEKSPAARRVFDEAEEALETSLRKMMFEGDPEVLKRTENAQPAILIHSIAALEMFKERTGVEVDKKSGVRAVLGHSLGEYTALVASGCVSLRTGVRLARGRGEAMAKAAGLATHEDPHKMVAVMPSTREALAPIVKEALVERGGVCDFANINSQNQLVLSGTSSTVNRAVALARKRGVARRGVALDTSAAFHSELMAPAASELRNLLQGADIRAPRVPIVSNVTADEIYGDDLAVVDRLVALLVDQLTSTVEWLGCMNRVRAMVSASPSFSVLELGPGSVLSSLFRKHGIDGASSFDGETEPKCE
eukprot:g3855.t1